MTITDYSIEELHKSIKTKQISIVEIVDTYIAQIERIDAELGAFLSTDFDRARTRALQLQAQLDDTISPLYGIPVGIKDVLMVKDTRTTAGSKILEEYTAVYTATAVQQLLDAGAIILGKNNCDEFAMGGSTEQSAFFPTKNPYDLTKVPGGSSGGSVAAVAARQVPYTLGTDTGGSIRQPSSFCGTVAFKPTYGLVSRYGLIAMGSSLDTIGPITTTVTDAALVLEQIAGNDHRDSTSYQGKRESIMTGLDEPVQGMRVGIPRQSNIQKLAPALQEQFARVQQWLESAGVSCVDIDMPYLEYVLATYYIIMPAEVSSNMARYDGIRYGAHVDTSDLLAHYMQTRGSFLGAEVKRRIMIGTYVLSSGYKDAYYASAQKARRLVVQDFKNAYRSVDAILMPTTPTTAFGFGEKSDNPLDMYLSDIYTVSANIAGVPALSLPSGLVDGMPYGVQLMGAHFHESKLVALGRAIEQERGPIPMPSIATL